jgi:protein-tyrosine kinase
MTRIFEALRKAQGRPGALPSPPAEPAPLRPPLGTRPPAPAPAPAAAAAPVATLEPAFVPRIENVPFAPLPIEVMRQMTALRVSIEAALEAPKGRIVMFVGAMGNEGVTTVAAQFAAALATESLSVMLLNARVPLARAAAGSRPEPARVAAPPTARGPAASRGVPPPARGVEASGRAPLATAALGEDLRRAGGRAPAAARATLQALSAQFDWVVVDGPPVLEAPESVDLAPLVGGVVLVIRSGYTKRPVAQRAAEMLHKSGVRVLGSVLNRRHLEIPDFIYRRI